MAFARKERGGGDPFPESVLLALPGRPCWETAGTSRAAVPRGSCGQWGRSPPPTASQLPSCPGRQGPHKGRWLLPERARAAHIESRVALSCRAVPTEALVSSVPSGLSFGPGAKLS